MSQAVRPERVEGSWNGLGSSSFNIVADTLYSSRGLAATSKPLYLQTAISSTIGAGARSPGRKHDPQHRPHSHYARWHPAEAGGALHHGPRQEPRRAGGRGLVDPKAPGGHRSERRDADRDRHRQRERRRGEQGQLHQLHRRAHGRPRAAHAQGWAPAVRHQRPRHAGVLRLLCQPGRLHRHGLPPVLLLRRSRHLHRPGRNTGGHRQLQRRA